MQWNTINTKLTFILLAGKPASMIVPRPYEAMPRWFKRHLRRLNAHHNLAENLRLKPKRRGRPRKAA